MYRNSKSRHDEQWVVKEFVRLHDEHPEQMRDLLMRLSAHERDVVIGLSQIDGPRRPVAEIARELGITPGRVHQLHRDARSRMSHWPEVAALVSEHHERLAQAAHERDEKANGRASDSDRSGGHGRASGRRPPSIPH